MTAWLAGMRITAGRLLAVTPETTTAGFTPASGFTTNEFSGRAVSGVCTVMVYVAVTSTINTTSGTTSNIVDTTLGTLPSGYRPADIVSAIFSTGLMSGECTIDTSGVITLRTSDYNQPISSGGNLRMMATFVLP